MTNLEALKELYVSLGGAEADVANVTTIADMIVALQDVASGGGGGGSLLAAVPITSDGNDRYTAPISYSEARERVLAGEDMVLVEVSSGSYVFYRLYSYNDSALYFDRFLVNASSKLIQYSILWGPTQIQRTTKIVPASDSSSAQ